MFIGCDEYLQGQFNLIGSIWLESSRLHELEKKISKLRFMYGIWGEAKWSKISPACLDFYIEFLRCFFDDDGAFFNCIILDSSQMNYEQYSDGDEELGFYKFCYQLINSNASPIKRGTVLHVVFDKRTLRDRTRYSELQRILVRSGYTVNHVGPCDSKISSAVQIADIITGAIGSVWNRVAMQPHCQTVVDFIESKCGSRLINPTAPPQSFGSYKINRWLFRPR